MLAFINLAFAVLRIVFAADLDRLDSPRFDERRAATKRLYDAWPVSAEACRHHADTTTSPEARTRSEHVTDERFYKLCLKAAPETWDEIVRAMIDDPREQAGLPWEADWMTCLFDGHMGINDAVTRYIEAEIEAGRLDEQHRFLGQPWMVWGGEPLPGFVSGLSDLRFRARGLPTPGEWPSLNKWDQKSFVELARLWRVKKSLLAGAFAWTRF